jgi:ParB-like chromosome segregation protein Spo0J
VVTKFHEDLVQQSTLRMLERGHAYQIKELRNSIIANGYVPMERIIVVPYKHSSKNKYLVVEGNRRIAALKTILRDSYEGSISITPEKRKQFTRIPCAILETEDMDLKEAERVIMGIRHIAGPREWGAYQQAQLIYELIEEQGREFTAIAQHIGLSSVEVGRRYRALKALRAMENDDEYSDSTKPDFYRLFHELVSLPVVRERFGWNQEQSKFDYILKAREFFELIAPQDPDSEPKLRTFSDVRKLKLIVGNPQAEAILLDPDQTFRDALVYVEPKDARSTTTQFSTELSRFHQILIDLSIDTLRGLSSTDIEKLNEIISVIRKRIEDYKRLQP